MTGAAIVVPRRADGGRRDELWQFCRTWWSQLGWPIHEAESPPGPFNRGAAVNAAVAGLHVDVEVVVIVDGDVVANLDQVQAAVDQAQRTGRATFAFTRYRALNDRMTDRVLAGYDGDWTPGARTKMTSHVSSILAVPRALWARTGGFDPRVEGWGHDDTIFAHTARVLGGGLDRVPGDVWHLCHPISPERTNAPPGLRASAELAKRYFTQHSVAGVDELLTERAEPDGVALVVITDGRRDCIDTTLPAAHDMLKGLPVTRTVICDDSGDIEYQAWLRWRFPDVDLVAGGRRSGFAGAVRRAWATALGSGQHWVFWLEDDFTIERPVDLAAMAQLLTDHPHVQQVALRRQPWFPGELDAGGIIEQDPGAYTDHHAAGIDWLEHQKFWTTNPHLIARATLAAHEWPNQRGSEALFGRRLLRDGRTSAYWGTRHDDPWVTHQGVRSGTGY